MKPHFPEWIRLPWASGEAFSATKDLMDDLKLHTVCQSARCPNMGDCWRRRTATFMILGNACTRNCCFCSVSSGVPQPPDASEPERVAEAARRLNLRHVVVTSVTRDDLPDGGAAHFAKTIAAIRHANPGATVEVLVPDFHANPDAIRNVLDAQPNVFGHNIETVERLYPELRGAAHSYRRALSVLRIAADMAPDKVCIKSALMLGHGETPEEVEQTMRDVLEAGCRVVYVGQYLRPTTNQRPVAEFVRPEQFAAYERLAYDLGFEFAVAGPLVRSSYRSDELMNSRAFAASAKGST